MPSRTKEEKERRRLAAKERSDARKAAREARKTKAGTEASATLEGGGRLKENGEGGPRSASSSSSCSAAPPRPTSSASSEDGGGRGHPSPLLGLPDDALRDVLSFLPSRELGATILTCTTLNRSLAECRVAHLLSRLGGGGGGGGGRATLCADQGEARTLLERSLGGGNTRRLVTEKSERSRSRSGSSSLTTPSSSPCCADEYVVYARFLEEAVSGYATQSFGTKDEPAFLPPAVTNGRFASASPEHSLCRVGGGDRSGAGGSGVASWGVGRRGQLGHGLRRDERAPRMLGGGIGYGIRIVQVSAGGGLVRVAHSLLLTSSGRVLSFGTAQHGQLGHGHSAGNQLVDELRPRYVDGLNHVKVTCVAAGELHSACVTSDGDVYSWGDSFCGQLGFGDRRPCLTPRIVDTGGLEDECVSTVSCGGRHTVAVTEDGEVYTWGLGRHGVLGREFVEFEDGRRRGGGATTEGEDPAPRPLPPALGTAEPDDDSWRNIESETLAQIDMIANLTLDDPSDQCYPKIVDSLEGIRAVGASAGHRHSMVLDDRGVLYTFGSSSSGALGHGDFAKLEFPARVAKFVDDNVRIMQMSAGVDVSMAVSTSGEVYAWGKSDGGRIGLPPFRERDDDGGGVSSSGDVPLPRRVSTTTKAVDVECGYVHSLIVMVDGTVSICGGVGTDGEADGARRGRGGGSEDIAEADDGKPVQIPDFNIWHRVAEPKAVVKREKWKKYGKYETKGRTKMMAEAERWS